MSLRDQLVKAGLVTKEKAKAIHKETSKRKHQAHRDKSVKAEIDAEKNREILAGQEKNRARSEMRELVDRERVNKEKGNARFNFSHDGKKIRSVFVTNEQHQALGEGKLMICRNDRDGLDYPVLPISFKERIEHLEETLGEKIFYYLASAITESDALDEWAAWDAYEASLKQDPKK